MNNYKVILFCSRHNDNKSVPGFKQRTKTFIVDDNINLSLDTYEFLFNKFVADGVKGESSRWYISVNSRDHNKIKKALLTDLINDDNVNFIDFDKKLVGIAMKSANRAESKFLFDFDSDNKEMFKRFKIDVTANYKDHFETVKTPNGWAIITDYEFDTRKIMDVWSEFVTLKRDAMRFYMISKKN